MTQYFVIVQRIAYGPYDSEDDAKAILDKFGGGVITATL